jgi:hypothetical protein
VAIDRQGVPGNTLLFDTNQRNEFYFRSWSKSFTHSREKTDGGDSSAQRGTAVVSGTNSFVIPPTYGHAASHRLSLQAPAPEVLPHVYSSASSQGNILSHLGKKFTLPVGTTQHVRDVCQ